MAAAAFVKDYDAERSRADADPEGFWAERAKELHWYAPWSKVLDDSNKPFYQWFTGGKTNVVLNAIDRHLTTATRNKLAFIWEGEDAADAAGAAPAPDLRQGAGRSALMTLALALVCVTTSQAIRLVPLESIGMSANIGIDVVVQTFAAVLPFTLVGASAMTIVASFTRSYKEAQTWLGVMMLVPTLPIAIAGVMNVKPTLALMLVPSMSQHLIIQGLLKAEPLPLGHVALSFASTLVVGAGLAWVAARPYRREGLIG